MLEESLIGNVKSAKASLENAEKSFGEFDVLNTDRSIEQFCLMKLQKYIKEMAFLIIVFI